MNIQLKNKKLKQVGGILTILVFSFLSNVASVDNVFAKEEGENVESLILKLKDPDKDVRYDATRALGNMGVKAKAAVPALIEAFKGDKDAGVRASAAEALRVIKDKSTIPALTKALKDSSINVRFEAAKSLGYLGEKKGVKWLIRALEIESPSYYLDPSDALVEIAKEGVEVLPLLNQALEKARNEGNQYWSERIQKTIDVSKESCKNELQACPLSQKTR